MIFRQVHFFSLFFLLLFFSSLLPQKVFAETSKYRSAGWIASEGSVPYVNLNNCHGQVSENQYCSRPNVNGISSLVFGSFGNLNDFGIPDSSIINKILVRIRGMGNAQHGILLNNSHNNDFKTNINNLCQLPADWNILFDSINKSYQKSTSVTSQLSLCVNPERIDQENITVKLGVYGIYESTQWNTDIDNLEIAFEYTSPGEIIQSVNNEDLSGTAWQWNSADHNAIKVSGLKDVVSIASGWNHSMAVKSDGTVWVWGSNSKGQFGDGNIGNSSTEPVQVRGPNGEGFLTNVESVSGGREFSMALKNDGTVWVWGNNWNGLRGTGAGAGDNTHKLLYPAQVKGLNGNGVLSDIIVISAGEDHSLALKSDKTVVSWGDNNDGELGIGCLGFSPIYCRDRRFPDMVKNISQIKTITAGNLHSFALKEDGSIWGWGGAGIYQLLLSGFNIGSKISSPIQITELNNVTTISTKGADSVVVDNERRLYSWGTYIASPLETQGLQIVKEISMGSSFRLALQDDGIVWKWWPTNNKPYKINNLTNVTQVAGGGLYSPSLAIVGSAGEVLGDSDSVTPRPFLDLPWNYDCKRSKDPQINSKCETNNKKRTFDGAALAINAFFDHEYPFIGGGLTEPSGEIGKTLIPYFGYPRLLDHRFYPHSDYWYSRHDGYDYGSFEAGVSDGDFVYAAASGSAEYLYDNVGGNAIFIDHGNFYQTRYYHLQNDGLLINKSGEKVQVDKNTVIGKVGATGNNKTGSHIHIGLFFDQNKDGDFDNDVPYGAVDPFGWEPDKDLAPQFKSADPWENYIATRSGAIYRGSKSNYLWKERTSTSAMGVGASGGEVVVGKNKIYYPPGVYAGTFNSYLSLSPAVNAVREGKSFKSIGPIIKAEARDLAGTLFESFLSMFTITMNFSDVALYNIDVNNNSFAVYSSKDLIDWKKEQTVIDLDNNIATATANHHSYFALLGEVEDTKSPNTSVVFDNPSVSENWFNRDVILSLNAEDDMVGVDYTLYKFTEDDWSTYSDPILISQEGKFKIEFYSVDTARNIEEVQEVQLGVDRTSPVTSHVFINGKEGNEGWYTSDVVIAISAQDEGGSGVDRTEYSVNDRAFEEYSGQINISSEGKNEIIYRSIDNAGNIEEDKSLEVNIDKTSPDTKMYYTWAKKGEEWFGSDIKVSLSADDAGSGVKSIFYKLNDGEYTEYFDTLTINDEGSTIISYYAVDSAGNKEEAKSKEFKIDKAYPVVNIAASPSIIWPPNGKMVSVQITGRSSDVNLDSTSFVVEDEYGLVEPELNSFGQSIRLEASRRGSDLDGRRYRIRATATDLAENQAFSEAEVVVPHDKGN